jgi:hypothetical protein
MISRMRVSSTGSDAFGRDAAAAWLRLAVDVGTGTPRRVFFEKTTFYRLQASSAIVLPPAMLQRIVANCDIADRAVRDFVASGVIDTVDLVSWRRGKTEVILVRGAGQITNPDPRSQGDLI